FVGFTQVDTDLELYIPDAYITNITERYNLYTELSKLENETDLATFEKHLADRFGPVPPQVKTMLSVVKLQWLGKKLGFEKISFKKNSLRGYFLSDKQSKYFDTETFSKILGFAQNHPRMCNLKEVKNTLRIAFDNIANVDEAIQVLELID
ncbi:MAG: transcription-repair coupling factor, partial [Pedobacter sp.]